MARRVPVVLTLDAIDYINTARAVKAETSAVDREMDQLDRSMDKVERDAAELAATTQFAAKAVDNLGDQASQTARALTLLDARLAASRLSVRALGVEFARTGDIIDGKALAKEQSLLSRLERLKKTLGSVVPDIVPAGVAGAAAGAGSGAASGGIRGAGRMSASNPYLIAAVALPLAAAAPAIGAMVGGILAGAIGTIGVAGGLAMASKDPQVQAAAQMFGDGLAKEFFRGGDAFVQPAIESMHILQTAFMDMKTPEAFAKVSDEVTVIAEGIGDLGLNLMPGLNKAFGRMGPYADVARAGFGDLGTALGSFMNSVTASPGAVLGLKTAFNVLAGTIIFLGKEIKFLSDAYGGLLTLGAKAGQNPIIKFLSLGASDKPSAAMQQMLDDLKRAMAGTGDAATDSAGAMARADEAMEEYTKSTEEAEAITKIFNNALSSTYSAFLDFEGASVAAEAAIDELADSFAENGTTLDKNTEAGRKNVLNLKEVADTALDAAKKKLAESHSVEEANAVYETYRQELFDTAVQAGLTTEQAQALVDKWLALGLLEDIDKVFRIRTEYSIIGTPPPNIMEDRQRAEGGPLEPGVPYLFGEQGPEIGVFGQPGQMFSAAQSAQMAKQYHGGAGSGGGIDYAQLGQEVASALQGAPILNYIEVGGEVVRVVDARIDSANRNTTRRVRAGVPA